MPLTTNKIVLFAFYLALTLNYTNPVQGNRDSPDPGVIYTNGEYYAVTTMGWDGHYFPIWKSSTGTNFTHVGWVFPQPPSWTACCSYWAPEIHNINGKFVAYYTAKDKSNKLCIGAAISDHILGPYVDKGAPLVTNASEGLIDATILRQGVNNYLVYKVDGNANGHPTEFWAVLLDPTGMATRGNPVLLMKNDQAWERGIIEGQWFVKEGGVYYLFYSGCGYNNDCYAVGIAKSNNALGPYTKNPNNPILKTRSPMT